MTLWLHIDTRGSFEAFRQKINLDERPAPTVNTGGFSVGNRFHHAFTWMSERKAHAKGGLAFPLGPGTRLDLTTGQIHGWYSLPQIGTDGADVLGLLEAGVTKRLVADAPLCCLVSGGLDSSLILALAKQHKPDIVAYTAFHDPEAAGLRRARQVCKFLGVELREVAFQNLTRTRSVRH